MTDSSEIDFAASTPTDWLNDSQPGEVDDALDQLAQRVQQVQPGTWADNEALRGDGANGIQGSGVTISDAGALSAVSLTTQNDIIVNNDILIDGEISALGVAGPNVNIGSDMDFQSGASILNLTTGSGSAIRTALGFAIAVKGSDETITSSTTMQDDDDLALTFAANETSIVEMTMRFQSPAAANFKMGFTFPSGTLHLVGTSWRINSTTTRRGLYFSTSAEEIAIIVDAAISLVHLHGIYRCGGTGGDLQLQWAQNVSDGGNTTVFADAALWKMRYA